MEASFLQALAPIPVPAEVAAEAQRRAWLQRPVIRWSIQIPGKYNIVYPAFKPNLTLVVYMIVLQVQFPGSIAVGKSE